MTRNVWKAAGALTLVASIVAAAYAQQAPAGSQQPAVGQLPAGGVRQGGGRMGGAGSGTDNTRVLIVGENPSIQHRASAQESSFSPNPPVTDANFWRVSWSPVGPGAACFITVNDPTPAAQKFVITDNPKLAEYIASKEVLERLIPQFNTPPYKVIEGTVTQATSGMESRTETCKGGGYTVELKWTGGIKEASFIDFPFARSRGVIMTLNIVNTGQQEIVINGKRAPGQYARGMLALNETWRVER